MSFFRRVLFLFVFAITFGGAVECVHQNTFPVIVDTDGNVDDLLTIAFLIKSDVEIKAITTVGSGFSHIEAGSRNILNFAQLAGCPNIPVALGERVSSSPYVLPPESLRRQIDGALGVTLPKNPHFPSNLSAAQMIKKVLLSSKKKITILCKGPLTNLAKVLQEEPTIKERIERVYIMGGALYVPGNVTNVLKENKYAEYNILLDAKAADIVFRSNLPITLVPLDATNQVPLKNDFPWMPKKKNALGSMVVELIDRFMGTQEEKLFFWDPLSAAIFVCPQIATVKTYKLKIDLKKGPEYGRILISNDGSSIDVVDKVDKDLFYKTFFEAMFSDAKCKGY